MSKKLDQIEQSALTLSAQERTRLAERLVESLAASRNTGIRAAWLELARQRRDAIRAGATEGTPGDDGLAMVRRLVGR